jgi:hypothetical protein
MMVVLCNWLFVADSGCRKPQTWETSDTTYRNQPPQGPGGGARLVVERQGCVEYGYIGIPTYVSGPRRWISP